MGFDTFKIKVIEAKNLTGVDKGNTTSDPYVVIRNSFNKQYFKTKVVKKNLNPHWDQEFSFFTSSEEGEVSFKVFDKALITKDECLGEFSVRLQDFTDAKEHDKWFPLKNEPVKKKNPKSGVGEVHLKLLFTGPDVHPKGSENTAAKTTTSNNNSASSGTGKEEKKDNHEEPKATRIEDKYDIGKVIGKGAFSVVKMGIRKTNQKKYAIKCISKKLIDQKEMALLKREIDIMKKLQHDHIVQLMEVLDTDDTLYLVLDFAAGGELFDAIVNRGSYSEAEAANIIKQILDAIEYIHNHGIAHRDLKPENLLLANEEGHPDFVKIADFGLSKDFGEESLKTSCGTPDYVAPEVLMGDTYDKSVDVWSIGVISYVLLCGFPPFYGDTQKELFENIMSGNYDFPNPEWKDVSSEAKSFIKKMLVVDPEKRYTARQCLEDPWILDLTKSKRDIKRVETFSAKKFKEYTQKYKEGRGVAAPNPEKK